MSICSGLFDSRNIASVDKIYLTASRDSDEEELAQELSEGSEKLGTPIVVRRHKTTFEVRPGMTPEEILGLLHNKSLTVPQDTYPYGRAL